MSYDFEPDEMKPSYHTHGLEICECKEERTNIMSKTNTDLVIDYLHDNYYDDMERMAHIKMIALLTTEVNTSPDKISEIVDKVAVFNNIKKSYPPS